MLNPLKRAVELKPCRGGDAGAVAHHNNMAILGNSL